MKKILKNPLKVIVAVAFIVAAGLGVSTSLEVSALADDLALKLLGHAQAQTEHPQDGTHVAKAPIIIGGTVYPCAVVPGNC